MFGIRFFGRRCFLGFSFGRRKFFRGDRFLCGGDFFGWNGAVLGQGGRGKLFKVFAEGGGAAEVAGLAVEGVLGGGLDVGRLAFDD